MRIGLIAALARTETGSMRAHVPLAGRSVLAWQVALLRGLGAQRIICLCDGIAGEILRLQHEVEAAGGSFHALNGFAAVPALVRTEDELMILRDGLVPEPALLASALGEGPERTKGVLCLPSDHPLAAAHPLDFERIDAGRHWAGVLMMRGAPVQQLSEFGADADATSLLLRLALQAGTPCRALTGDQVSPTTWLLADTTEAVRKYEAALIAEAALPHDWRAPFAALAARLVRKVALRGINRGGLISAAAALVLLIAGVISALWGAAGVALALAAGGAFGARVSVDLSTISARLRRVEPRPARALTLQHVVDALLAAVVWLALSPWPDAMPLALCGPIAIGLARLAERDGKGVLAAIASDRAGLMLILALGAGLGFLAHAAAVIAAGFVAGLLLNSQRN
jgi:hypothetical protein